MEQFLLNLWKTSLLGALMIAAMLAAKPLWRSRYRAKARCWLWLALAALLLLPVDLSAENAPVQIAPPKDYTVFVGKDKTTVMATDALFGDAAEARGQTPAQARDTVNEQPSAETGRRPARYIPVTAALFWLWAAGAAAFLVRQGAVYARFRRTVRRWRRETTREDYTALLESTARELNVTAPRMLVCEAVTTPAVTGALRPTLLLPHEDYNLGALRFILRHELCHLKRRDMHLKLALLAANAMHWFNPMVYLMLRQADEDIELACDSAATDGLTRGECADYSRVLLSAAQAASRTVPATTCFGGTVERLKRRIENVLSARKKRGLWLVALVLAAALTAGCAVGWGGTDELASPFGKNYEVAEVVYQPTSYSFTLTADDAPCFRIGADGQSLTVVGLDSDGRPAEAPYGALEEYALTGEDFDDRFLDSPLGWASGTSEAAKLRRNNAKAWHCTAAEDPSWPEEIYLLQQKDGTLYLLMGYDWEPSEQFPEGMRSFRWLFRLTEQTETLYASMDDYAAKRVEALKSGTMSYCVSANDTGVVEDTVADVRVTRLELGNSLAGLSPDGTVLELWYFEYEMKPTNEAGYPIEPVGGQSVTDDGYLKEGFTTYLTALHYTGGDETGYRIINTYGSNDGLYYNGCSYENSAAYLHDIYVDYAGLDLPKRLIPDLLGGTVAGGYGHVYSVPARLVSGDGWYLYIPTMPWDKTKGEDSWYSLYFTGSTLRVDESNDSVETMERFYRDGGFTLEQYREGAALSGPWRRYDADSGTQFENYLIADPEKGGYYIVSTCWQPTDDASVDEWGYSKKGQIEYEAAALRAMAQSFTVAPELTGRYKSSFDADIALASDDGAAWLYLIENDERIGGFDAGVAWNTPALNFYDYVPCDAPEETSSKITLLLSNNDSSHLEFYKGTNVVGYFVGGENEGGYYMADGDFSFIDGDGRTLYDHILMWYDEAEFVTLQNEVEETPIPNRGQSWEDAAQEYLDAYEGVHLKVRSGSQFKFTWVKNLVEPADDRMELKRKRGELEENEYYFYATTEFVVESKLALRYAMAGNTGGCDDPDAPEGAYEYYRCCTIRLEEDGWHGTVGGTGW